LVSLKTFSIQTFGQQTKSFWQAGTKFDPTAGLSSPYAKGSTRPSGEPMTGVIFFHKIQTKELVMHEVWKQQDNLEYKDILIHILENY